MKKSGYKPWLTYLIVITIVALVTGCSDVKKESVQTTSDEPQQETQDQDEKEANKQAKAEEKEQLKKEKEEQKKAKELEKEADKQVKAEEKEQFKKEKEEQKKAKELEKEADKQAKAEEKEQFKKEKEEQKKAKELEKEADKQAKAEEREQFKKEKEEQKKAKEPSGDESTLEGKIDSSIKKVMNTEKITSIEINENSGMESPNNKVVLLKLKASDGLSPKMIRGSIFMDTTSILKTVSKEKEISRITIFWSLPLSDSYGNSSDDNVMTITFNRLTIDKINFDSFVYGNIPKIADDYWEHPVFKK
ncbi:hypothetical protein M3644_26590 [Bacillus cereus]|uniref:hypothetical protein n=1 Tax=Bacillus cereus TaxID=1396 RepID=UPI00203BFC94|nr:hypothetical protein [Bacillus cereus]MCM3223322.1 hypothetical protein [Bacillus cereus]